jgi:membrane fusion protein, heavy metal efflux system
MNKNTALTLASALALALALLTACSEQAGEADHDHAREAAAIERGAHGGRLLHHDDFDLELAIFEAGVPPEFRVWLYESDKALSPSSADVQVDLKRLDGTVDTFTFKPENDYLRGSGVVAEPHSFDVAVTARTKDESMEWKFSSYEGRTTIAAPAAQAMGVAVATAAPGVLKEEITLAGTVQADPTRMSRVRARYPGVVREVRVEPLSVVARGAVLAQVQSNESLQNYPITAPIAGTIVEHRAQIGEATGEEALFTIIDVSKVWVELDVFQSELGRIDVGQPATLFDLDNKSIAAGRVDRLAPLAAHGSQSVRARVVIENAASALRPGQFVSARVLVGETTVPLAIERKALQRFRDFDVVFERIGDVYEVRMLALGRADSTHVEVLAGLKSGAQYVTGNSYLIKADIEKSGASHDH